MTENYDTNIVPIGRKAQAGRGNPNATPSIAARSLAGASPVKKKPAKKIASPAADIKIPSSPTQRKVEPADEPVSVVIPNESSSAEKPKSSPNTVKRTGAKPTKASRPKPARTAKKTASKPTAGNEDNVRPITKARSSKKSADTASDFELDDALAAVADRVKDLGGEDWQTRLAGALSMIRHRLAGEFEVDEFGLDREFVSMLANAVGPLIESWFRLEVRGIENIPADGGALLVGNHSGTLPVDALVTGYVINQHAKRFMRPLSADLMFSLPLVGQLARKSGATLACNEDAERLLGTGELAAVWPEGFKGVGKPYSQRYKLQRFGRGGFVASAVRARVPIVPVSIVGAEEIYPLIGNVPSLARFLGLPYLPITPFFPWLGPLGLIPLPSKWIIEFGEPIRTDVYEPSDADDPMLLFELTDQVREAIQQNLYSLLADRGNPFI